MLLLILYKAILLFIGCDNGWGCGGFLWLKLRLIGMFIGVLVNFLHWLCTGSVLWLEGLSRALSRWR